jgi:hypothetical protein
MRYVIPALVGAMYAGQGLYHLYKGEVGFTVMWLAYSIANVGIILAMSEGKE